jgi:hypothetical protein
MSPLRPRIRIVRKASEMVLIPIVATGVVPVAKRQRNVFGIYYVVVAGPQSPSPFPVLVFEMRRSTGFEGYRPTVPVHIGFIEGTSGAFHADTLCPLASWVNTGQPREQRGGVLLCIVADLIPLH